MRHRGGAAQLQVRARLKLGAWMIIAAVMVAALGPLAERVRGAEPDEVQIALNIAKLLQAGRSVISADQDLINDPNRGNKGLTGAAVLAAAVERYKQASGVDPAALDSTSREGRLLQAEMASIREVIDENQDLINEKGAGFKGFIPATFARLVTERLQEKVGDIAQVKVTAPPALVRNRKSRPDNWEKSVILGKFLSPGWPRGQVYWQVAPNKGRQALRVMVPEYYDASCLTCHGQKKGEMDITGYPKEGASKGDLGGIISITLFRDKGEGNE